MEQVQQFSKSRLDRVSAGQPIRAEHRNQVVSAVEDLQARRQDPLRYHHHPYVGPFAVEIRNSDNDTPDICYVNQGYVVSMGAEEWPGGQLGPGEIWASEVNHIILEITCDSTNGDITYVSATAGDIQLEADKTSSIPNSLKNSNSVQFLLATCEADADGNWMRETFKQRWQGGDIYVPTSLHATTGNTTTPLVVSMEIGYGFWETDT